MKLNDDQLRMHFIFQITGARILSTNREHDTELKLTIEEKVTITESFYPAFSPLRFLTMMGGAVGLWLGVGFVQMIKYVAGTFTFVCSLKPNKY